MVMTLHIPEAIYEELLQHARAELPNESVGMLIGTAVGQVVEYVPMVNELKSPTKFLTEPRSMLKAEKRCRELNLQVLAIVHSHPSSEPVPSKYDIADHYSSTVMSVIVSLMKPTPAMAGWWIAEGSYQKGEIILSQATA